MYLILSKKPRKNNRTKTKRFRAKLKPSNRGRAVGLLVVRELIGGEAQLAALGVALRPVVRVVDVLALQVVRAGCVARPVASGTALAAEAVGAGSRALPVAVGAAPRRRRR